MGLLYLLLLWFPRLLPSIRMCRLLLGFSVCNALRNGESIDMVIAGFIGVFVMLVLIYISISD